MQQLKCIIVDDNDIDRLMVEALVKRTEKLQLLASFENAQEALNFINENEIEIVFLDIDMPDDNGISLRKKIMQVPVCVFISSHPEFAIESFEINTLDFIVKPLKLERFEQCLLRIQEYFELRQKAELFESSLGGDVIYIKEGHNKTKIKLHDIMYLEALKDYTKIVTSEKKHYVLSSLGNLIQQEHFVSFVRIHRSFAVQKNYVKQIFNGEVVLNSGITLPLGRAFRENLNFSL